MTTRKLWIALIAVFVLSFGVLGYYGVEIYRQAPPIPERVVAPDGKVLFNRPQIQDGQNVWQSMGGQEVGTVWGHGAYVAPDWSADWLHREAVFLLDLWAKAEHGAGYDSLDTPAQAALRARLQSEVRTNTYNPENGDLTVSADRAAAIAAVSSHYDGLFGSDPALATLRDSYAIPANAIPDPELRVRLQGFFFWAAWACGTNRPGQTITYTNNWPAESLIGNSPTGSTVVWSVVSFIALPSGNEIIFCTVPLPKLGSPITTPRP